MEKMLNNFAGINDLDYLSLVLEINLFQKWGEHLLSTSKKR